MWAQLVDAADDGPGGSVQRAGRANGGLNGERRGLEPDGAQQVPGRNIEASHGVPVALGAEDQHERMQPEPFDRNWLPCRGNRELVPGADPRVP
jgi:hypothetical protein